VGLALVGLLESTLAVRHPTAGSLRTLAKALYAAGALTRYHSAGQRQFWALGGGGILARALDTSLEGLSKGGALGEGSLSCATKALHLLADLALATEDVTEATEQAPTSALLRIRLEAAAPNATPAALPQGGASSGPAAGDSGSARADSPPRLVRLERAGTPTDIRAGGGGSQEELGGSSAISAKPSAWLQALKASAGREALCTSARAAVKALSDHVTPDEISRIVQPCGGL
jgi:hypothetical protein